MPDFTTDFLQIFEELSKQDPDALLKILERMQTAIDQLDVRVARLEGKKK